MATKKKQTPVSAATGLRIRAFRERRGWSLPQLAKRMKKAGSGMGSATIAKKERGDLAIDLDDLFFFAEALAVSPIDLLLPPASSPATANTRRWFFMGGPRNTKDKVQRLAFHGPLEIVRVTLDGVLLSASAVISAMEALEPKKVDFWIEKLVDSASQLEESLQFVKETQGNIAEIEKLRESINKKEKVR